MRTLLRGVVPCLAMLLAMQPALARDYRDFSAAGVNIAYSPAADEGGRSVPVIFLHGLDGAFEPYMSPLADRLGLPFAPIGVDLRGHGRSDKPHGDDVYGRQFAADIIDLMDSLAIERAHLVGHSLGGIVAVYLAAQHPQRLHSVVTIGNGLFLDSELRLMSWLLRGMMAWNALKVMTGMAAPDPRPGRDTSALVDAVKSLAELGVSEAQAAAIRVPMLAIRGGPQDDPRDSVERLVRVNPAVQMLRIESADHMSVLSSEAAQQRMRAFLLANNPVAVSAD